MTLFFLFSPPTRKEQVTAVPKKKNILLDKLKESLASVLPITGIVLLLTSTIAPLPVGAMMAFVIGAIMLIFGMALFTLGTEMAMTPLGERVGVVMTKSRNLKIIIPVCFAIGVMITMSEPDLTVLATQVPSIPNMAIILSVAVGVGAFLVVALLRIVIGIRLSNMLVAFYALVFILAFFAPNEFLAVAFDSGGVTTGPMTVPFIMALGVGISSIRSDKHAENDSFGMVALCSVGPILAVLVLSLIYRPGESLYTPAVVPEIENSRELALLFVKGLPAYISEVFIALAPILAFFLIFQLFFLKLPMRSFLRYAIGLLYTYVGLVLFLTGVNVGFMPVGMELGRVIASQSVRWLLIPIGMVIGYFIVAAEPAVHVLNKQVEELTNGNITAREMQLGLSMGVALSVGMAMLRILTGISILWFLIPGYAIALLMTFRVSQMFTGVAFDSGGVASGPMTAAFLSPLAMGACEALGGNMMTEAFGIVAMVAMTPLVTIQLLGLRDQLRRRSHAPAPKAAAPDDFVWYYDGEEGDA